MWQLAAIAQQPAQPHAPVAAQRVDLSVVPQQPHGLCAAPAWEGVGAEAAVYQRHVGAEVGPLQVCVVHGHLGASTGFQGCRGQFQSLGVS